MNIQWAKFKIGKSTEQMVQPKNKLQGKKNETLKIKTTQFLFESNLLIKYKKPEEICRF
jgi:hypothetical protein